MSPPAPVVTDQGVYGTLPDRRRVEREYAREERPWRDTLVRLLGTLLAVGAAVWLVLLSAHQATGEQVARPALGTLVETMTGLPDLLTLHEETIRATGEVPGFPLAVTVPAEDRAAGPARWLEVVRDESAALLYEEGADAFNPEGGVTTEGTFSTSGGARLLINNVSAGRHSLAGALLLPAGIVAALLALGVVAVGSRFGRFQALGFALAVAGIPALGAGALGYAIVTFAGSDGSALAEAGHEIAWSMAGIAVRNGLTVLVTGSVVVIAARILSAVFERERTTEPLFDKAPGLAHPDWRTRTWAPGGGAIGPLTSGLT
ncbi:MAG: hypothetical protein O2888_03240, partial [Chloroflexi bacterium]|nr:hypothetical protein [Chloroflexota bacterium]